MDFDAIESLNEEELNELYDTELYDMDVVRMSDCTCRTASGGLMHFGSWYADGLAGQYAGDCRLQQDAGLYTFAACLGWCRGWGFSGVFYLGPGCFCVRYSECNHGFGWAWAIGGRVCD